MHKVALSRPTERLVIEERAEKHADDQEPLSVSKEGGSIKLDVGRVRITIDITPLA